ncbi:unnamed protein product [Urochloa humidicola]
MAGAQELPLQVPRREGFLALIGASLVVLSLVVKPPVHAWCALAGFLLWLMGMARLLLFGRIELQVQRPVSPAALAAATAKLAVGKVKCLFFGRQAPAPPPAPEPAAAPA